MMDPTRLLDEGATEAELAILKAGATEEPPEAGRRKLAVALGVSAGLSTSVTAAGSKAAGAALEAFTAHAGVKWIAALTVGALAGGGLYAYREGRSSTDVPRQARATSTAPPIAETKGAPEEVAQEAPQAPEPVVTQAAPSKTPPPAAAEPSARGAKSIGVEIEKLDGVRRALRSNVPADALRLLDEYDRAHAGGVLGQEAALLRIEALAASGNKTAARAIAERFLRENPKTPHRRRISALVGDGS